MLVVVVVVLRLLEVVGWERGGMWFWVWAFSPLVREEKSGGRRDDGFVFSLFSLFAVGDLRNGYVLLVFFFWGTGLHDLLFDFASLCCKAMSCR